MIPITLPRATVEQALEILEKLVVGSDYEEAVEAEQAMESFRAALAQQAEPDAYGYASRLAVAIWEKHYKDTAPHWKPLDDLVGVLTQIDNMAAGMARLVQQAEPVALTHRHEWFGGIKQGQFRCIHCGAWVREKSDE